MATGTRIATFTRAKEQGQAWQIGAARGRATGKQLLATEGRSLQCECVRRIRARTGVEMLFGHAPGVVVRLLLSSRAGRRSLLRRNQPQSRAEAGCTRLQVIVADSGLPHRVRRWSFPCPLLPQALRRVADSPSFARRPFVLVADLQMR